MISQILYRHYYGLKVSVLLMINKGLHTSLPFKKNTLIITDVRPYLEHCVNHVKDIFIYIHSECVKNGWNKEFNILTGTDDLIYEITGVFCSKKMNKAVFLELRIHASLQQGQTVLRIEAIDKERENSLTDK